MNGYVTIPRFIFDDPSYVGRGVKFSRPSAIIDLIQLARISDGREFVNGRFVEVRRGQLCKSIRELSARWGWDEKTVSKFLNSLTQSEIIACDFPHSKRGLTRIISIVNYDCWCDNSHTDSHTDSGTAPTPIPAQLLSSTNADDNNKIQEKQEKKEKPPKGGQKKETDNAVDHLYSLYPTRCPLRNSSTGKSSKCKTQIIKLLRTHSAEELEAIFSRYVAENLGQHYLMNFSTFLNNLPDYSEPEPEKVAPPMTSLFDQARERKPQQA